LSKVEPGREADKPLAVITGASSAIGSALADQLKDDYQVITISRGSDADYESDYSVAALNEIALQLPRRISLLIICNGLLHGNNINPEKSLRHLSADTLLQVLQVNTVVPAMILKAFHKQLAFDEPVKIVALSARVGSISENQLGGWYAYRAAKSALNQIIRTAAIELGRRNKQLALVAIHPGTTYSPLSAPFAPKPAAQGKSDLPWMNPAETASHLLEVIGALTPVDNGTFLDWQGNQLSW